MSRNHLTSLALIVLAASPICFAQNNRESRDRRLDDAVVDIRLLKRLVDEQDRRITELEKTVKALQATVAENAQKPPAEAAPAPAGNPGTPPAAVPWQIPFAWGRVMMGMSRMDVEQILGPPTSVDSVLDYQTLNYRGATPGGGTLSGSVRLTDDRVSQINLPDF